MSIAMLTAIVAFNIVLALACLLGAWRLWKLRQTLRQVRWMLGDLTQTTQAALQGATDALISSQQSSQRLHWRYGVVHQQLRQLRTLLLAVSWVQGWLQPLTQPRQNVDSSAQRVPR